METPLPLLHRECKSLYYNCTYKLYIFVKEKRTDFFFFYHRLSEVSGTDHRFDSTPETSELGIQSDPGHTVYSLSIKEAC